MAREDGRPLVTEHAVTGMDMIDVIPRGELELPENVISCRLGGPTGSWGDDDPSPEDFDSWGA